jgi:hypothetical protein
VSAGLSSDLSQQIERGGVPWKVIEDLRAMRFRGGQITAGSTLASRAEKGVGVD